MAEEKRLIGDDGRLCKGYLDAVAESTEFENGEWYQISTKDPADSVFGDLAVGDFYYAPVEMAAEVGDAAYQLHLVTMADLSGWSLSLTGDEVEVTVLADRYKKYRRGKLDANGTISLVFIKGITDQPDDNIGGWGLANYFFDIVEIEDDGNVTYNARLTDPVYVVGYACEEATDSVEVTLATVLQIEFYNFEMPMNISEAVNMEIPFRLIGDNDPILYRITNPGSTT